MEKKTKNKTKRAYLCVALMDKSVWSFVLSFLLLLFV